MSGVLNLGDIPLLGDEYPLIFEHTIPVTDGLESAFLLAHGAAPERNYAPGKANAAVTGAPTVAAGYTQFNGANYLRTGVADTDAITIVAALYDPIYPDTPSGDEPGYLGNYASASTGGIAVYGSANGRINFNAVKSPASAPNLVYDPTAASLFCFRSSSSYLTRIQNLTAGTSEQSSNAGARVVSSNVIRIGTIYLSAFDGPTRIGMVLLYSRVLSDTEVESAATWAREYMASQGVIV